MIEGSLYAEVHRLVDLLVEICTVDPLLRDHTRRDLHDCVVELLVAFDRYRAYVVPGEPAPPESVRGRGGRGDRGLAGVCPEDTRDALDLRARPRPRARRSATRPC